MPEQSAKEKIKEFLSSIITEHNSQLAATYLTKTQAAQIVADSSSEKLTPILVLGTTWTVASPTFDKKGNTYTAHIIYDGDGELSTNIGTINGNNIIVESEDGEFGGVITASETNKYASHELYFQHTSGVSADISTTTKLTPTLSLGEWETDGTTFSVPITYNGDGTLYTSIGTISNGVLIVEDVDGSFSGTISASEGTKYIAVRLSFKYSNKRTPTLSLGEWAKNGNTYTATITYTGDGELTTTLGTITGNTLTVEDADGNFSGAISASDTANYFPSKLAFNYATPTTDSADDGYANDNDVDDMIDNIFG